ncbi:MAG: hypothetical protein ACUVWO_01410 [Thermodesulfobacteriota bacterium]
MKCSRCHGSMSYELFQSQEGRFWGWRCLLCGEIVDEMVLENRQRPRLRRQAR